MYSKFKDVLVNQKLLDKEFVSAIKLILSEADRRKNVLKIPTDEEMIGYVEKLIKGINETEKLKELSKDDIKLREILNDFLPNKLSESDIKKWFNDNKEKLDKLPNKRASIGMIQKEFGKALIDTSIVLKLINEME